MNRRISYWLIPAEPHLSIFRQIVSTLAERFGAPVFEPHVTIYSGTYPHDPAVDSILDAAVANVSPIQLRTVGPGHSEEFTRTLFVKFNQSQVLTNLSRALEKGSAEEPYRLEPHLSLVYARIPSEVKQKLADEFRFPSAVSFDRVAAMETGGTLTKTDVERWRAVVETALHCA